MNNSFIIPLNHINSLFCPSFFSLNVHIKYAHLKVVSKSQTTDLIITSSSFNCKAYREGCPNVNKIKKFMSLTNLFLDESVFALSRFISNEKIAWEKVFVSRKIEGFFLLFFLSTRVSNCYLLNWKDPSL